MNNPDTITGAWVKEQCDFAFKEYAEKMSNNPQFVLNPNTGPLRDKLIHYQSICPHEFNNNGICIYCKKKNKEATTNEH